MEQSAGAGGTTEDTARLAEAVRESVHRQIVVLLEEAGAMSSPDLIACPRCGTRIIMLDMPRTYALDRRLDAPICAACAAERDVTTLVQPEQDIGGEGG